MSALFLSRISLLREASIATLAPILFDAGGRHPSEAARRLLWTLFADRPDRKRDFLWREDAARRFYVLSRRSPEDKHRLFKIETKAFEPALSTGDRLVFSLRANATVGRARGAGERAGKRDDVVMAALKTVPPAERAASRKEIARREGLAWLQRQGEMAGFETADPEVAVDGYEPLTIRGTGKGALRLSIIEFGGLLTVREPATFLEHLARGFGRGKAFGLGLMLLRRA
jgi:CRISPR system Cascade subunit CasE